ncbi:DUF692 domain-containing protein (plasmid) [Asticcacaulis sp. DW145]|uniref:DUF692 domain-containing protein n=1 Tax=Asticcacaulis currens TaxID=2984210 RepID=A0ABT5IDR8_9CAUL|nr:DUF692 domain-containing protein [Asticcacaulis currens]MDC7694325.1 DUF692 domain-containing protein [Asticcacaulis currens]BEV13023.1 DUF692 domain-containing protein [Asticcacaulis sp. DW145]
MTIGAGLGLKPQHHTEATGDRRPGLWFEVHPENYMVEGGPRLAALERARAEHPLSLHGVGLSLGGPDPLDAAHLKRFRALIDRFTPFAVSEHLAWSRFEGQSVPDLLPVLRTTAELQRIAERIDAAQTALGRALLIENPSHYLNLRGHDYEETDFLSELVRRTGCGLLVDLNNVFVSARNIGIDPQTWLGAIPAQAVGEIHLAGHSEDPVRGAQLLIDSHDRPVADGVWALLDAALDLWGPRPVLIERDGEVPAYAELIAERERAQSVLQRERVAA